MAASQGYQCEFIDSVSDDFYCKMCNLVARRLSISTCCGENFCYACLADIREQGKPCPECGEKDYNIIERTKNQTRINCLQVYCSMKERGCDWSGTLEQLDTHLDPDQDNCQYVDIKCPLNCHITIPKNKVEQHVAQHCTKRPHVCQHCNFKATYEDVVNIHLQECKYVPLQCPNLCGVTFERDFMEDHMNMCRLEEVKCEFSGVGCDDRFRREDQEEHTRQNSQNHLTLTASLAVETKEQLQQKLLEQDKKHEGEEEKLRQMIEEQEKRVEELKKNLASQEKEQKQLEKEKKQLEMKLASQDKDKKELEKKLVNQDKEHKEQEKTLKEEQEQKLKKQKEFLEQKLLGLEEMILGLTKKSDQNESNVFKLSNMIFKRTFEMKNYSAEKAKDKVDNWFSQSMYTHASGYKFCIGVDANGDASGHGKSIYVSIVATPGEFDDQLKWPARARFTTELINQTGGENVSCSAIWNWEKPTKKRQYIGGFCRIHGGFLEHTRLNSFLKNDTLCFYMYVSEVKL